MVRKSPQNPAKKIEIPHLGAPRAQQIYTITLCPHAWFKGTPLTQVKPAFSIRDLNCEGAPKMPDLRFILHLLMD